MKHVLVIVMSLISLTAVSQSRAAQYLSSNLNLYQANLMELMNTVAVKKSMESSALSEIDGSPYLMNDFTEGAIITKENIEYGDVPLRYNVYNDKMEFQKNDMIFEIGDVVPVYYVTIGPNVFVKFTDKDKTVNEEGYYQLVSAGDANFYVKRIVIYKDEKPATGYQAYQKPQFKPMNPDFYIQKGKGNPLKEVKNKKDVLKLLSDKKAEISKYISKNKLNVKKERDLKMVMDYYNSLNG